MVGLGERGGGEGRGERGQCEGKSGDAASISQIQARAATGKSRYLIITRLIVMIKNRNEVIQH